MCARCSMLQANPYPDTWARLREPVRTVPQLARNYAFDAAHGSRYSGDWRNRSTHAPVVTGSQTWTGQMDVIPEMPPGYWYGVTPESIRR